MPMRIWERHRRKIAAALVILPFVNFFLYALIAEILGGDAVNGKVDGGRYYLGLHGQYTEVSRAVFTYSKYHTYAIWATSILFLTTAAILEIKRRREASKKDGVA